MVTRHLDSLYARGNTSDVYRWGASAIVKVLRPGIPVEWAAREARTTELVHAAGLPAPAVLDVTTVDGRPGIVFERIGGSSMWERMLDAPAEIPHLAGLLADLQREINSTPAPSGLPKLVDRLDANIDQTSHLTASERNLARAEVPRASTDRALCHFDVHPNNVLMDASRQPIVIDWFDAASGSPVADVVRSSVLMRRDAVDCHLPCPDPSVIDVVHDQYIAAVVGRSQVDVDELLAWEPAVLAARLSEPVGPTIVEATRRAWSVARASQSTRLAESLGALGS